MEKLNKENIAKAVNDLINKGDLMADPRFFMPKMEITDIWKTYKHLFTDKAKTAILSRKVQNLIVQYNEEIPDVTKPYVPPTELQKAFAINLDSDPKPTADTILDFMGQLGINFEVVQYQRKLGQVRFFGTRVKKDGNFDDAVKKIAKHVNDCAENNYIMGHLAPLSTLSMADDSRVIIFYLAFNEEGVKYLDNNKIDIEIKEGECPPLEN